MTKLPGVFHVNWFRRDADGKFLWPGYGENLRVLAWIIDRCKGSAAALDTPIGAVPTREALDFAGLDIDAATIDELLVRRPRRLARGSRRDRDVPRELRRALPPGCGANRSLNARLDRG